MSAINVSYIGQLTIVSTRTEAELPSASGRSITHSLFNQSKTLNADSTPPATKKYANEITSTATLDLTALADPEIGTVDGTGLKVQAIQVNNLSTTNTVTIADGGANPYQLFAGQSLVVPAGACMQMFFNDKLADIAVAVKNILFTATAGQKYQVVIVMG